MTYINAPNIDQMIPCYVLVEMRYDTIQKGNLTLITTILYGNICFQFSIMQFKMFKVICLTSNFQMIENLPPGIDNITPYSVKKLDEQQILYENNKRFSAT